MLNRLAPISNTKNKKTKILACTFLIALFHFEANLIKWRFFLFSGPFWTVKKILPSRSEAEKISLFRQKIFFLLSNLVPRLSSFYIRTKSRLKNGVIFSQCKTNFFISLSFWGRNLGTLRNIYLGKPPLVSKKIFLIRLRLSTFVYTRLRSSTFV